MKVIVIGDIHGRDTWKEIVKQNPDADLFVFVGDYFDSFDIDTLVQINNFKAIIDFRKENPTKVITLIGNHDFHYTSGCIGSYSGFNYSTFYNVKLDLDELIRDGILIICHVIDDFFFSHAGVTNTWCDNNQVDKDNVVQSINDLLLFKPNAFNFISGKNRSAYGDDITQGPLWVRPVSLKQDRFGDYIYVVGHTQNNYIDIDLENKVIQVDALYVGKYLELVLNEGDAKIIEKELHIPPKNEDESK